MSDTSALPSARPEAAPPARTFCGNFSPRSLAAFLCVGGAATAAHYLVMALLMRAGVPAVAASGTGYVLSALLNYLLNEQLTFRGTGQHRVTAPRFAIVALSGLLLNHLLLSRLTEAGLPTALAQLLTTTGVIVWNYCIHGAWTFSSRHR